MKRLKIMYAIRQGKIGGGETYLLNLVTKIDQQKFEPIILSFTDGEMVEKMKAFGLKTYVIHTERPFSINLYPKIQELMKKENIKMLHIHGTRAATNSLIPARKINIPIIYTVHGWSFHTGNNPLITKLRILAERFITKRTDKTVCGSEADLKMGRKYCPGGEYRLISNSIDTDYYDPSLIESDFRTKHGYSDDDLIIAFISRITFQKDPFTFIRSIPKVLDRLPNASFLIVGDGELKQDCKELAKKLGVEKRIRFLPFTQNVKEMLKEIDLFVLPSLWEVVPLALLEAMAMEKVCIGTNIQGTTEALEDGVTGYLFEPGDHKGLSNKIIQSVFDSETSEKIRQEARRKVVKDYDLKNLVRKNEELYLQILAN